jgi:AcrR family transcriptional regulator
VTGATTPDLAPPGSATLATVDGWASDYVTSDGTERRLVEAALRCVTRWGIRKTSLDDIAREATVSRATVYRMFPGGKDRLVEAVFCHEAGRLFHEIDADLANAATLEELLFSGITAMLRVVDDHAVVSSLIRHEPDLVLPHFAFHQLGRVLDLAEGLCRPHLERFLPPADVRPAAELLARVVLTFGFRPAAWVDPHDPDSIRRLVSTYLLPAITPSTDTHVLETT